MLRICLNCYGVRCCVSDLALSGAPQTASCRRGDQCPFSHGVFESWLHPSRYRTQVSQQTHPQVPVRCTSCQPPAIVLKCSHSAMR